ncbi:MAG: hypothetical protein V4565_01400 [Bacteroidota bacterium]
MEKATHNKRKQILIGLTVLGTGVAGFLGWNYWKNKRKAKLEEDSSSITESPSINTPVARNDDFPLKRGSKGNRVTQLQNALVKKYGAAILPKYGVDGMFGKEVEAALVRAKLPTSVNETTYNSFVGAGGFAGIIKHGDEIITLKESQIIKTKNGYPLNAPRHTVLGRKEFTHEGWVYFTPKNSTELFKVRNEQVKSLNEFKK